MRKKQLLLVAMAALMLAGGTAMGDAITGLEGYWPLDADARDFSGHERHGTLIGDAGFVGDGMHGGALELDGDGDYVSMDGYIGILQSPWTLACWVKTTGTGDMDILSWGTEGGGLKVEFRFNGGLLRIEHGNGNIRGDAPANDGQWHHAVAVLPEGGVMKNVQFYLDGKLLGIFATGNGDNPFITTEGTDFNVGRSGPRGDRYFTGLIDEVRIYSRVLSQADILEAMETSVAGTNPLAYGPVPADGSRLKDTWVQLGWKPGVFAASHNVYLADNFDAVNAGTTDAFRGNHATASLLVGLPGYAYPDGLVPGTTYYWRADEVNDLHPDSPWTGNVWSFSIAPRTAYDPNPADGAEFVALTANLTWTPGLNAKLHTVYFGESFDDVNSATTGGALVGTAIYSPASLKAEKVYYWRVDETDPPNAYKGQVWSFTTLGAVGSPHPSNGTSSAEMNAILTWVASDNAASHQIYFGTDKEAVRKATTTSPEYKGVKALGAESYDPGLLAWDSTYYWRVDEVNNANAESPWKGPLWSFTTGDFLLVDDFESYNDIDPPDPASNRIFDNWIDGFGTTTNGALVGNDLPPYAERKTVHSGKQSMPYSYDNNLKNSEAARTLAYPRDWTQQGVTELSLWFRGRAANAAERMYVVLNGTAVVYNDDTSLTQKTTWTEWVIPLQQFATQGVNLTNVTSITIGFGTRGNTTVAGGTGQMYFDDIRLYRPATP